jgi:hypothetical protein
LKGELGDADVTSCALISERDLDAAYEDLKASLGRDTYPGELYAAVARQLGVERIIAVFAEAPLGSLLDFVGPGQVRAKRVLHTQTRQDLEQEDFKIEG